MVPTPVQRLQHPGTKWRNKTMLFLSTDVCALVCASAPSQPAVLTFDLLLEDLFLWLITVKNKKSHASISLSLLEGAG